MGLLKEFKEFAVKGNVIDLAVGVIIGGAFGKIADSVVNDLIMPIVSAIIGKPDFSNLFFVLGNVPPGTATTTTSRSNLFFLFPSATSYQAYLQIL